jgi:hypothetical protein
VEGGPESKVGKDGFGLAASAVPRAGGGKMVKKIFYDSPARQKIKPLCCLFLLIGTICAWRLSGFAVDTAAAVGDDSRVRSIVVDGFFDPARNFLDATARLCFARPAAERRLWLAEGLQLSSVRSEAVPALEFKRNSALVLVQSLGQDELEFRYSGRLVRNLDSIESSLELGSSEIKNPLDDCCLLSYINDFYPHPQLDFTPMKMNIHIPAGWNCLGSGTLLAVRPEAAGNTFMFDSTEAKGMALVCGRFSQIGLIAGAVPIRLHGRSDFRFNSYFREADIGRVLDFYNGQFGTLDLPELNVLFRSGRYFSGISYNGLIVLNVDEAWTSLSPKARRNIQGESPLLMIDAETDLLAHEIAHQWWGGLISWKAITDNWITEGLATYSAMQYLRESQGDKAYRKICNRLRRQVKKFTNQGIPADGYKLKLLIRDFKVYQTLVYAKPALMLAALADRIGAGELCLRLRSILKECRCRNVDSAEFLRLLSGGNAELHARLKRWICSRELPDGL